MIHIIQFLFVANIDLHSAQGEMLCYATRKWNGKTIIFTPYCITSTKSTLISTPVLPMLWFNLFGLPGTKIHYACDASAIYQAVISHIFIMSKKKKDCDMESITCHLFIKSPTVSYGKPVLKMMPRNMQQDKQRTDHENRFAIYCARQLMLFWMKGPIPDL